MDTGTGQKEGARWWQMEEGDEERGGRAEVDEDREEEEGGRKRTHIPNQSLSFPPFHYWERDPNSSMIMLLSGEGKAPLVIR